MPVPPRLVVWTDHALAKAELLNIARTDVEDAVLNGHPNRSRNTGAADWLIVWRGLAVAYNHPVNDDALTARVITIWRTI